MGSITFHVVGDASVGTRTKTYAVSDADVNRLIAYIQQAYPATPTLTIPQALLKWADLMMTLTKERVLQHERRAASLPPFEAI